MPLKPRLTIIPACLCAFVLLGISSSPAAAVSAGGPTIQINDSRMSHGADLVVRGLVRTGRRRSSRREWVRLFFRANTSRSWRRIGKVPANRNGRYRVRITASRNGYLRALSSEGTASATRRISVSSRLTINGIPKLSKVGARIVIRGVVRPAGRRKVNVVVRGVEGAVIRTTTKSHGGFAVSFKPKRSGSHSVRVYAGRNASAGSDVSRRIRVVGLRPTHASYYGPGLYGNGMACGGTLYPDTRGVAHKTLPCGTRVTLRYGRKTVVARVVDRGPYVAGREFDLTEATRDDLGFGGVGTVWTNR